MNVIEAIDAAVAAHRITVAQAISLLRQVAQALVRKHAAGKHDQQSHGHRAGRNAEIQALDRALAAWAANPTRPKVPRVATKAPRRQVERKAEEMARRVGAQDVRWIERLRQVTFPTGLKGWLGRLEMSAPGFRTKVAIVTADLDGRDMFVKHHPGGKDHDQKTHGRSSLPMSWDTFIEGRPNPVTETRAGRWLQTLLAKNGISKMIKGDQDPPDGWMVSIPGNEARFRLKKLTPEVIRRYVREHLDALQGRGAYFGGWVDPKSKDVFLDVSRWFGNERAARAAGKRWQQLAIFHVDHTNPDGGDVIDLRKRAGLVLVWLPVDDPDEAVRRLNAAVEE